MLTNINAANGERSDKTIALEMPLAATVYYTVPHGRVFRGYFTSETASANLLINAVPCLALASATATPSTPPMITLVAGDTVSTDSVNGRLIGTESYT